MTKTQETKVTNEKPVKIPLDFKEALAALLKTKPSVETPKPKKKGNKTTK
jgi:hypothetical protein